jgi:hypothetical protein
MSDPYVHQNLTSDARNKALEIARSISNEGIPLNTGPLEKVLFNADEFNKLPLSSRKGFFEKIGLQPVMATKEPQGSTGFGSLFDAINTTKQQYQKQEQPQAQPQAQPSGPTTDLFSALNATKQEYEQQKTKQDQTAAADQARLQNIVVAGVPEVISPGRKVGKVKDMAETSPMTQFGRAAASLYDVTLGSVAPGIIEPVTYAGARALQKSPEEAKRISTAAAAPFEQPMGRTLGITETPEYKGEAGRRLVDFIGENFQKGAAWIAEKTGLPAADIENMMGTVLTGAGVKAAPAVQRGVVKGAETVETALGTNVPKAPEAPRIEPTLAGKPKVTYAEFQAQLDAKKQGGQAATLPPAPPVQTATMPAPTNTQPFPVVKYAQKGSVNLPEQEQRKQILARVGLENARQSSILGDGFGAANEFQTSKVDAPVGQLYRDTLANERATLENFGQEIIKRTGGTLGLDETALYDRGVRMAAPFDAFKNVLQTQMDQAYNSSKQIAGTKPAVIPTDTQKFLDTNSNFTVNDSFMSLRRGIESHLKENDLLDADGKVKPMTVEQAEGLRRYINSNWNNERSGIIGRLKDKIDNDVTKVAGEDVYKKARDIRTKIARLLDDPKGVAKIMDYDPQSPMNRAVPFEKIASTIERMDVDQQRHLIKLLKEMPDELRPQADAAIAEIKAQFANRILQEGSKNKGQWNADNITKYLNDNNRKLGVLMEDKELAQMVKDLHDAGHLVKYDASYPGAAIQAHNLIKLGAAPLLGTLGGATGSAIGGSMFGVGGAALGGASGAAFGAARGVKMAEKSALKRAQKKMVPLKDVGKGK